MLGFFFFGFFLLKTFKMFDSVCRNSSGKADTCDKLKCHGEDIKNTEEGMKTISGRWIGKNGLGIVMV